MDLNDVLGRYSSAADAIVASLLHKPDDIINGEITVDWFPADASNQHGMQVIRHSTSGYIMNHYIRARRSGNWGGWNKFIKDTNLYTNDFVITKSAIPLIGLSVDENKKVEIYKNASSSIDAGTYINDYTDGIKTSVVIKNNRISVNNNDVVTTSDISNLLELYSPTQSGISVYTEQDGTNIRLCLAYQGNYFGEVVCSNPVIRYAPPNI